MKEKTDALKSAREEKRREVAEQKLYDHWRENNPELREVTNYDKITGNDQYLTLLFTCLD